MTSAPEGLESALDGLLSGLDELLAQRPEAPPPALAEGGLSLERQLRQQAAPDITLHVLTALLHESPHASGLQEAAVSQIRRLVLSRTVERPEPLAWRGPTQVSPRLMPWLQSLVHERGLQVWASPEGEWLYVAQAISLISDLSAQSDVRRWVNRLSRGFPVVALAEVIPPRPQATAEDDPHHVVRLPRLPEFCRLLRQGESLIPHPEGEPCMARWLDVPMPGQPQLLGVAWPLLQTFDEHLGLPIPVVSVSANLG
ncbi:MAG: hypothetical protein RLY30_107 [Pseudomonadota bacterium]